MRASRLVCALLLLAVMSVPAVAGVRIRSVSVSAGYIYRPYSWGYYGPYWSPFWSYASLYYPEFYGPYLSSYGAFYGRPLGEVKLETRSKAAEVYVNGGYAGVAGKLKTIWLEPGAYDLEVRGDDGAYSKRIYVLSGKTLRLEARLMPEGEAK